MSQQQPQRNLLLFFLLVSLLFFLYIPLRQRFFPFGTFTGHVQILQMDVNGDGLLDVIARALINGKKRTRTFLT